jgi:hypothetical protein
MCHRLICLLPYGFITSLSLEFPGKIKGKVRSKDLPGFKLKIWGSNILTLT